MNILSTIEKQIVEMFEWLEYEGIHIYNVVYISPLALSELMKYIEAHTRYGDSEGSRCVPGAQRVCIQTKHAIFFVDTDRGITDDDLLMKDIGGSVYSYNSHYLSEVLEQTVLKGNV